MADRGTQTWPEPAIGLYDALTGRGAEITYNFPVLGSDHANRLKIHCIMSKKGLDFGLIAPFLAPKSTNLC